MTTTDWLAEQRGELAVDRILDAAAEAFAAKGVGATSMADIADRAGCSRATLYRNFSSRHELRRAFVNRETLRVMADVDVGDPATTSPDEMLLEGVLGALRSVRSDPALAAWFAPGDLSIAAELSDQIEVLDAIADGFLATAGVTDRSEGHRRARWLVRSFTSLLVLPEADHAEERRLIADFLIPAVLAPAPAER
jgi:AcrR family transcriptional regulator